MSESTNNASKILDELLTTSEGFVLEDEDFSLPTDIDFASENFSVDLYNKLNNGELDFPLYLETPFSTKPGYYEDERVFIATAVPYVKAAVKTHLGSSNTIALNVAESHEQLNSDDGDTVYFMNETLYSGESAFTLGDRSYENLDEFLNIQSNKNGKFGVRFLGINTPEIPHYTSTPMIPEDIHEFKYGEIKSKSNFVFSKFKIVGDSILDRTDDETMSFFYDSENSTYYEIVEKHFAPGYLDLDEEKKKNLESLGGTIGKIVYTDESVKTTVKKGLEAAATVREMIGKAEEICLMLDQQSLNRQSNYYESPYNNDYYSYNFSHALTPWNTIKNYWNRFFSDARYKYMGFNAWGQDNNKRMLGTIYLKVVVPELGGDAVWINLSKYILQKYSKDVEALPDYTSDPKENLHNGFCSSAFKLWTYNFTDQVILDAFTSYTDDFVEERDKIFEELAGMSMSDIKEYTMILGDNVFIVPPTSIRCMTQTQVERVQLLRSRGSATKQAPMSEKMIELKLYFNNEEGINGTPYEVTLPNGQKTTYWMNGLRSLIAQFKLTPFLPIENNYVNQVLNVYAVTLMDLQVSTMPGFPKCLQVTLTLQEFNYHIYMPELPLPELLREEDLYINMFARCIHYPVMRWYYQRLLQKGEKVKNLAFNSKEYIAETFGSNTALVPMDFEDSLIEFYLPDKKLLDRRLKVFYEKESKPLRASYELTDNGKELIRQMAPVYNDLLVSMKNEETASLGKKITEVCTVDYSGVEEYYPHTLFDITTNSAVFEDNNVGEFYKYNYKLIGIDGKDSISSLSFANYTSETENNFFKSDFGIERAEPPIANFVRAINYDLPPDDYDGRAKITGSPYVSKHISDYLNSFTGLSEFGGYQVKESIETYANGKEGRFIFDVYVPLPQVLSSQTEREEFLKTVITQLKVANNSDIFDYNSAGALCVKIRFQIPTLVYKVNLYSTMEHKVHVANGAISLDTQSDGFAFLGFCDQNVKSIYLEDGTKEYLDYTGNAMENMSEETIELNTYNYLESESSIDFEKYDFGEDINIQSISCSYSNSLARVRLNAMDGYAHQFCGGQDSVIEISITTKNEAAASLLQNLPRIAASYVIDYKEILPCWPLRIKSEITKLFGINEVLVEAVDLSTVPNYPGLYSITLRMVSVDRSTRNRETLKKLEEINNASTITNGSKGEYMQNTFFDLNRVLGKAEIYPDLELPLVDELEYAGYKLTKYYNPEQSTRKYLDPDFYFVYAYILTHELLKSAIQKGLDEQEVELGFELNDKYGSYYLVKENTDTETNLPMSAEPMNDVAVDIQKQAEAAYATKYVDSVADTMNKRGWLALKEKYKLSSKLPQTLAGMKTPFWSITDKFVFPLREEQYKLIYKGTEEQDTIYYQQIKSYENKMYSIIDNELNYPINMESIDMEEYTKANFPGKYLADSDTLLKWVEDRIDKFSAQYTKNRSFINELAHDNINDPDAVQVSWLKNILLAFADSATGYSFCETTKVLALNLGATEDDKYSTVNWKLKMFNNFGGQVYDGTTVNWDELEPYCKTRGRDREFAMNLDDAIEYGTSFGIYQIQMYPKAAILDLMVSEYEKQKVMQSKVDFVFLDPYYRALQLDNPKSEELKDYKMKLLLDPAFCAYAYMRNLMVWYKYLMKEEIALSMYETIKSEAAAKIQLSIEGTNPYGYGGTGETINNFKEDKFEEGTNKTYEEVFAQHAKAFAIAYAVLYDTKNNNHLATEAALEEEGVPDELYSYVDKYKNKTEKDLKSLESDILENLNAMKDSKDHSDETKETYINNYKLMLSALGYDYDTNTYSEITQDNLLRYGVAIVSQYVTKKEESRVNNQTFKEIVEQLTSNKSDIIKGKLIGLSLLLLKNGGSILAAMRRRETYELDSLMLSLPMPTVNGENNDLRKYVLALDGRGVLELEYVGNSTQTAEELVKFAASARVNIRKCNNIREYLKDSFLDMIKYDKRGRMLRAFPTYYMLFIDEGREIGLWKLHDNFYNMNAISEITVTKSRKIAADTAQITMSNMFKTFSTDDTQKDYDASEINNVRYNMRDAFNSIFSPRVYAMKEETLRQMEETPRAAQINPGVRVHIRMGYGANAADLPVLFNGCIAEVGTSDLVDIVAQGDGVELLNPITDIDDASDVENKEKFFIEKWVDNWLTNGATPKQIMTSLLISRGTWLQELLRTYSNGRFFNRNPYGIVHFGDQEFKDIFSAGEVVQNIYEANPRATYGENEKYSGLESNYDTSETPVISMHLLGKTFWDVMHICASVQPDYITSVVPFGMRSSIFYGAPRYYYAYDYVEEALENGGKRIKEKRKPFQQYHLYSSFTDIIHNNIRASATEIKTNAVGLYQESHLFGDKVKQVGPLFVDFDIYPEYQKSMTVDTQLWAKGMPVLGNAFGWTADLSKDVSDKGLNPIPGAKEIAWRMTASALKNSIKDMYTGELSVIGDPTVKPYDRMVISDAYERMDGQCEVEAVVHTLNPTTGFTTSIYADCISIVDDQYEQYANIFLNKVMGYASASLAANCIGAIFNKNGRPIVTSILKMASKGAGSTANIIKNIGSFLGQDDLAIVDDIISSSDKLLSLTGHSMESTFLSVFKSSLKGTTSKLTAYSGLNVVNVIQADDYLKNLAATLEEIEDGTIKKQITKKIASGGDDLATAKQALSEYNELAKLKKTDISSLLKADDDLISAVTKLTSNSQLDDASKAVFNQLRSNPDFLSDAKNITSFRNALVASEQLGDDALDVAKALKTIMNNSDDIAKAALSMSDDILTKGGLKALFTSGSNSILGGIAATGVWPALILMVLEMAVTALIGGYATEFVYRYLQNLEVLKIYPLKRKGRVMVAGIDGHKGIVVGSPTENQQGEWTQFVSSLFDGEKGGFVKSCINLFLDDVNINTVAKRLRTDNDLPEKQGSIDSDITLESVKQAIAKDINSIYSNNGKYSAREVMRLDRIMNLEDEDTLGKNLIDPNYKSGTMPSKNAISLRTSPIQEDEEIKPYLESNFANIFTASQSGSIEPLSINFNGKDVSMQCYTDSGAWIVPTLRYDAMLLLKDCLRILFEDSDVANYNNEEKITPHVFITSATIIGGKASWENTGYAFRLQLDGAKYTEEDAYNFTLKIKDYYNSIDVPNYMECYVVPNNKTEILFIVKPVETYE